MEQSASRPRPGPPQNSGSRDGVAFELPDGTPVRLQTDKGLFSFTHVDPGTKVLLDKAPSPPFTGEIVDLGCGYGPISAALASQAPDARVWSVDVNPRARELTALNTQKLGLTNVTVIHPEEVPEDLCIDALYSNPPLHTGKADLHQLLQDWLGRMNPGSEAWMVVKKSRGSDSLLRWLVAEGFDAAKVASRKGYRIIRVHFR